MITAIVSPYSFSGSILKIEDAVKYASINGARCLILCDTNFHATVKFIDICKSYGIKPIISFKHNNKVFYAKNTYELYELFEAYNKNDFSKISLNYIPLDEIYFAYYLPGQRYLYEIFSKFLGCNPVEKGVLKKIYCDLQVSDYNIKSDQVLPKANKNFLEFKNVKNPIYKKRIEKEVSIIKEKNFVDYFFTVYKIVKIAKKNNIKIGPGRGSAVGSLVSYFLGITSVDPIKYDLLFERFLNKGRNEPPDIDLDVEDTKRKLLIEKIREEFKYVYYITTFSSIGEKTLKKIAYENKISSDKIKYLLNLPIHKSVHAAGIIISKEKINVPIKDQTIEWDMESLHKIGYIKFDLLGLKTLTILSELEKKFGVPRLNDQKTFHLISKGFTNGIFQLDSNLGKKVIRTIKPRNIKELSIALSLNRPGPLKAGIDKKYANSKIENSSQKLDVLKDTNGVLIFQEQIMKIATEYANFTEEEADVFRKAVSKKDKQIMKPLLKKLKDGLLKKLNPNIVNELIETIIEFSEYAFNKSHAIAYAHITYYLSYFKTHFPKQFYKTILKYDSSKSEKIILELHARGFKVIPPNLTQNELENLENNIFEIPITLISGINEKTGLQIIKNKPYNSLQNFLQKNPNINYSIIESLIKIGSFDYLSDSRRALLVQLKELRTGINTKMLEISSSLFGKKFSNEYKTEKRWERCDMEYTTVGFCISKPVEKVENKLSPLSLALSRNQKIASHVSVIGGYATDGISTIKLNVPDGEYTIIPEKDFLIFQGQRKILYEIEKLNAKEDIEKGNEFEYVSLKEKRIKIKNARPVLDEYTIFVEGEKNVY